MVSFKLKSTSHQLTSMKVLLIPYRTLYFKTTLIHGKSNNDKGPTGFSSKCVKMWVRPQGGWYPLEINLIIFFNCPNGSLGSTKENQDIDNNNHQDHKSITTITIIIIQI